MNYHRYFNQIQLSSVNPSHQYKNQQNNNDSIIDQINLLEERQQRPYSPVNKIESFVYAEEAMFSGSYLRNKNDSYFRDEQGSIIPHIQNKSSQPQLIFQKEKYGHKLYNGMRKAEVNIENKAITTKRSIKEELIEQNKLLQQRLSSHQNYKSNGLFNKINHQNLNHQNIYSQKGSQRFTQNKYINAQSHSSQQQQIISKLQELYNNSNIIKLYNFIMKELPICEKCKSVRDHIVNNQKGSSIVCKKCKRQDKNGILHPLIGVMCDIQNRFRFQEQTFIFQSIIEQITKQEQKLKNQILKIKDLKENICQIRNTNRKKFKQISQCKFYIKKHLNILDTQHLLQLQNIIPTEYIDQMERWREVNNQYQQKWDNIYRYIYKLMPLYIHEHSKSKLLSGLYKILNYEKDQSVKISVSQPIKFPIKQMGSAVFMVDGSYNLPIFENIKQLKMQFHNKKTLRQLNLLFSNFPRQIYSLTFNFNHKLHSHISAENFPFMRYIAPLESIKMININIQNAKQFEDVLNLLQLITPKIQFKLKITRHLFSKQQLILPENFYNRLIKKLGHSLVKFQVQLPEDIGSYANINYQSLCQIRYLCVYALSRGQKDSEMGRNMKILQNLNEEKILRQKRKKIIFKKLICQRLSLIRLIKSSTAKDINLSKLINSVQYMLTE